MSNQITLETIYEKLVGMEQRFEERFEQFEERFEQFEERFEQFEERFDRIDHNLANLALKINGIDSRLERLESEGSHEAYS